MTNVISRFCLACCLMIFSFVAPSGAQNGKEAGKVIVGRFPGGTITEDALKRAAGPELDRLEIQHLQAEAAYDRSRHKALETVLNRMLEERVLDTEAAARSLTREALLDQELAGKVKKATMEDLNAHYSPDKLPPVETRKKIFARLEPTLNTENYNNAKSAYVDKLKKKYGVIQSLPPQRLKVDSAASPAMGPDSAPVTVVEFIDFQCTSCASFDTALRDLQKKYATQIRLVSRSFAFQPPYGEIAAEAALCAGDQGRFWEMHDRLLETGHPEPGQLNMHAAILHLDLAEFGACMSERRHEDQVRKDLFDGARLGVTETPAVFVNGRPLVARESVDAVASVIEEELHRQTHTSGSVQAPQTKEAHAGSQLSEVHR